MKVYNVMCEGFDLKPFLITYSVQANSLTEAEELIKESFVKNNWIFNKIEESEELKELVDGEKKILGVTGRAFFDAAEEEEDADWDFARSVDTFNTFDKIYTIIAWPFVLLYSWGDSKFYPNRAKQQNKYILLGILTYAALFAIQRIPKLFQ